MAWKRLSSSSAGTKTIVLNPAPFRASNLQKLQPRIAQLWGGFLWLLGVFGTIIAFNGGFENTLHLTDIPSLAIVGGAEWFVVPWTFSWYGISARAWIGGIGSQLVFTVLEFVFKNNRWHPGYLIPFSLDAGSNFWSYKDIFVPAFSRLFTWLFKILVGDGLAKAIGTVLAYMATFVMVIIGTMIPEMTFVEDDTGQPLRQP